jgi:hypothetical protein
MHIAADNNGLVEVPAGTGRLGLEPASDYLWSWYTVTYCKARSQKLLKPHIRFQSDMLAALRSSSRRIIIISTTAAIVPLRVLAYRSLSLRTMSSTVTTHPSLTKVATTSTDFLFTHQVALC